MAVPFHFEAHLDILDLRDAFGEIDFAENISETSERVESSEVSS